MVEMVSGKIDVIGVPMDLGANIRGANMGPAAIRIASLQEALTAIGFSVEDLGDVNVPIRESVTEAGNFLGPIVEVCRELATKSYQSKSNGRMPICVGGDHSLAIGSVRGVNQWFAEQKSTLGLIWIDAHADLNTPQTSESGNIHGMPLSVILGRGYDQLVEGGAAGSRVLPENTVLLGIRSIDEQERRLCKESGISYYTMREIDERGVPTVMAEVLSKLSSNTSGIHLSLDIDGIDPLYAPGVSTPVSGGLTYREIHLALEMIADTKMLSSMDIVELNPMFDEKQKTARLAVELVQSALGKSII